MLISQQLPDKDAVLNAHLALEHWYDVRQTLEMCHHPTSNWIEKNAVADAYP